MTQTATPRLTGSVQHMCFVTVDHEPILAAARNQGIELIDADDGVALRVIAADRTANSLLALRKASVVFDAECDFAKIRAKVLYVLSRTDKLFPPSLAPGVMDQLKKAGIQATYFEIDTELGNVASGPEWAKWGPTLRTFLEGLPQ